MTTILRLIDRAFLRLGAFALTFALILLDAVLPRADKPSGGK